MGLDTNSGWTDLLEAMDEITTATSNTPTSEEDVMNTTVSGPTPNQSNADDVLAELDKVFTPVLVMQGLEKDIGDQVKKEYVDASVLTEKNVVQFDNQTRMAQLISVCALLLAKHKNTDKYQMYQKAALLRNKMKVEIQKDEYDDAVALAQKYLVKVSTSNNSSVARDAATALLPETQH